MWWLNSTDQGEIWHEEKSKLTLEHALRSLACSLPDPAVRALWRMVVKQTQPMIDRRR